MERRRQNERTVGLIFVCQMRTIKIKIFIVTLLLSSNLQGLGKVIFVET